MLGMYELCGYPTNTPATYTIYFNELKKLVKYPKDGPAAVVVDDVSVGSPHPMAPPHPLKTQGHRLTPDRHAQTFYGKTLCKPVWLAACHR